MRLIDADALIDCIKDDLYNSYKDDQWYRLIADALIETIEDQQTITKWIPCSERLPETDVDVLAYYPFWYDNMYQNTGIVVAKLCFDRLTWDIVGEFNPGLSAITHWMPLPERPKM